MRTVCGESRKLAVSTTGWDSIAISFGSKRIGSVIGSKKSRDDPVKAFVRDLARGEGMSDEDAAELAIAMARALAQPEAAPARRHHVAERVAATGRRAVEAALQRSPQIDRHRVAARCGPARAGPEQLAAARPHLHDDAPHRAADRVDRDGEAALLRVARLRAERRDPEERPGGAA